MIAAKFSTDEMHELIRPLLARFSENEETVRQLMATDASFDALCDEYGEVVEPAALDTRDAAGQRLLDGQMLNAVLVLMLTTSILGPVLTAIFAPRLVADREHLNPAVAHGAQ